jgi:outer membrane beta-barrel protein
MVNRFKHILLERSLQSALGKATVLSLCLSGPAVAEEGSIQSERSDKPGAVQVIKPEVEPRKITEAKIDDEFFEVGAFAGYLTIDNFGSEPVYGLNATFHATEDFFLQGNYGMSSAGLTSFEQLNGDNIRLLSSSDRDYTFYNLLVGYNVFPGEVFLTSNLTFNSAFYLVAGVGNTKFAGEDNFTTTLGTGYRIILQDWLTWHIDYRDHIFKSDVLEKNETTNNIELSTGISLIF